MTNFFNEDRVDVARRKNNELSNMGSLIVSDIHNYSEFVESQPSIIECYSFMKIDLYSQLVLDRIVTPTLGVSCSLISSGAYYALERRYGMKFFGWLNNF